MKPPRSALLLLLALSTTAQAELPYAQAGLSKEQAARHLLQRMSYGPLPGQVEQVARQGLESWFEAQLHPEGPDPEWEARARQFSLLTQSPEEVRQRYGNRDRMVAMAEKEGLPKFTQGSERERQIYEARLREVKQQVDYRDQNDLLEELRLIKLHRARYSQYQLREVMVDFWFNHFNVNAADGSVRYNLQSYEQTVIRPHCLGKFEPMLQASACHPAMLFYLGNARSTAQPERKTTLNVKFEAAPREEQPRLRPGQPLKRKQGGLNENYAREVMELHTMGVDGGYTQQDVTELARALTGWTVLYPETDNPNLRSMLTAGSELGYLQAGEFLFRADQHDAEAKTVLGHRVPAGGGLEEGQQLLHQLAQHPSTARTLSRKLARRFLSDDPSEELVERLAARFTRSQGDIAEVLRELLNSQEFWQEAQRPSKVKSPLEYFLSAVRGVDAQMQVDRNHHNWLNRMGQPLYVCAPPTGYPEDSRQWISSSTLIHRINFAHLLAENRLGGLRVEWWRRVSASDPHPQETLSKLLLGGKPVSQEWSAGLLSPEDGYPRSWFFNPMPEDLEQRRNRLLIARLGGVILASPDFQYR